MKEVYLEKGGSRSGPHQYKPGNNPLVKIGKALIPVEPLKDLGYFIVEATQPRNEVTIAADGTVNSLYKLNSTSQFVELREDEVIISSEKLETALKVFLNTHQINNVIKALKISDIAEKWKSRKRPSQDASS